MNEKKVGGRKKCPFFVPKSHYWHFAPFSLLSGKSVDSPVFLLSGESKVNSQFRTGLGV